MEEAGGKNQRARVTKQRVGASVAKSGTLGRRWDLNLVWEGRRK